MFHRAVAALALTLAAGTSASPTTAIAGCLASGDGYLRARVRGAVTLDLDWKNEHMHCEGGPRPSGNGVRVSIAGPKRGEGRRLRFLFGIGGVGEGGGGSQLPTNVTMMFEGESRMFATRGDDKCVVDTFSQQRVEALGAGRAIYRVVARGFCVGPASSLTRRERVFITSFDFAGRVEFGDDDRHAPTPPSATPAPTS
jgi:hypothetical protein